MKDSTNVTNNVEAAKRANVEGLNKAASVYFEKELEKTEE